MRRGGCTRGSPRARRRSTRAPHVGGTSWIIWRERGCRQSLGRFLLAPQRRRPPLLLVDTPEHGRAGDEEDDDGKNCVSARAGDLDGDVEQQRAENPGKLLED